MVVYVVICAGSCVCGRFWFLDCTVYGVATHSAARLGCLLGCVRGVRFGGLTVCFVVVYAVKLYLLIVLGSFRIGYCLCLYLQFLVMDCLLLPLVWFCLGGCFGVWVL